MVSLMSPEENSYSFLLWPKMMTATSTEHSTESSCAFLNRPPLRFRNVTERLRSSLMALISIFLRPMVTVDAQTSRRIRRRRDVLLLHSLRTVVLCGWRRRVLEEQKKLVLACAADDGQRAANTLMVLVSGGQQQAAKVGAQWMGVEKMVPRLDHGLYVYDVRNGGPRQLSRYLEIGRAHV